MLHSLPPTQDYDDPLAHSWFSQMLVNITII